LSANPQFEIALVSDVWRCPDEHDHIWTEEDDVHEPLYECADCGPFSRRVTGNHQCPECNKFGSKISDYSCPEDCTEEMESILAYKINDIYYIDLAVARGEDL